MGPRLRGPFFLPYIDFIVLFLYLSGMEKKDVCILCGSETPYYFSTPIHLRNGYVEGAGQGCYSTPVNTWKDGEFSCPDRVNRRNKSIHLIEI